VHTLPVATLASTCLGCTRPHPKQDCNRRPELSQASTHHCAATSCQSFPKPEWCADAPSGFTNGSSFSILVVEICETAWQVSHGRLPRAVLVAGEDRGDVLRGYPVKVEVDSGQIGRLPRLRERLSGPRHARGLWCRPRLGALRCRRHTTQALAPTASPNGGTCNHRYHDQEDGAIRPARAGRAPKAEAGRPQRPSGPLADACPC
jgi:hypothetical protein